MLLPSLAIAVGVNEALMLQQIHYWLDPRVNKNYHKNRFWVYNSYTQWQRQFPFWSERTLRRSIKSLEDRQLLIYDFFNRTPFDKTKWYSVDYDNVSSLKTNKSPSGQIGHIDMDNPTKSSRSFRTDEPDNLAASIYISENTTETTKHSGVRSINCAKEAVQLWNSHFQQNITLTKNREKNFKKVFLLCFEQNIDKWEGFLKKILESGFLMGKITTFKASFDWATKEDHIYRILEGTYSRDKIEQKEVDLEKEGKRFLTSITDELWREVCLKINEKYGPGVIWAWFRDLKWEKKNNTFTVRATTKFKKEWVATHYYNTIKEALLRAGGGEDLKLEIV